MINASGASLIGSASRSQNYPDPWPSAMGALGARWWTASARIVETAMGLRKRRVLYFPIDGSTLPVFDRWEKTLQQWIPGERCPILFWDRLLLDDEGLACTLDIKGNWVKGVSPRFVLDMTETPLSGFAHYLHAVASRSPSKGVVNVVYRIPSMNGTWAERASFASQFLYFGLVHTKGEWGVPPGPEIAPWGPAAV